MHKCLQERKKEGSEFAFAHSILWPRINMSTTHSNSKITLIKYLSGTTWSQKEILKFPDTICIHSPVCCVDVDDYRRTHKYFVSCSFSLKLFSSFFFPSFEKRFLNLHYRECVAPCGHNIIFSVQILRLKGRLNFLRWVKKSNFEIMLRG